MPEIYRDNNNLAIILYIPFNVVAWALTVCAGSVSYCALIILVMTTVYRSRLRGKV